jgi:adenylate cyclase
LTVPLLHPSIVATTLTEAAQEFGEEREVTILFVDIRGSTSLAEARLPYDVIFLLNALFVALAVAARRPLGKRKPQRDPQVELT